MSRRGAGGQRGFTLVEVLVALVVVALGMAALLETFGSAADTASWLRDRTFAQWIAFNQLTYTRISGQLPGAGQTDGELDFAGRHWRWRQVITAMSFPGVVLIEVKVQPADTPLDEKHWMATVTGGIGDAVAPPQLASLYTDPGAVGSAPGSSGASSAPSSAASQSLLAPPAVQQTQGTNSMSLDSNTPDALSGPAQDSSPGGDGP